MFDKFDIQNQDCDPSKILEKLGALLIKHNYEKALTKTHTMYHGGIQKIQHLMQSPDWKLGTMFGSYWTIEHGMDKTKLLLDQCRKEQFELLK